MIQVIILIIGIISPHVQCIQASFKWNEFKTHAKNGNEVFKFNSTYFLSGKTFFVFNESDIVLPIIYFKILWYR